MTTGKRIVVIEKYIKIDIDSELVLPQDDAEEDILLLNNGCLCCTRAATWWTCSANW